MPFFDLVNMRDDSLAGLAGRLGYKKVLRCGSDVEIIEKLDQDTANKKIIRSDDFETISKALKQSNVIGFMPKSASVSNKTLDAVKACEKLLFVVVSPIVCADSSMRNKILAKTRSLVRNALRFKVPFSMVTLAEDKSGMLSAAQMLELAGFFGIPQERAKETLSRLGGFL